MHATIIVAPIYRNGCMPATRYTIASVVLDGNCMPSILLQLSGALSGGGFVAYIPLGMQLQVSPPTTTACIQRECNSMVFFVRLG